MHYYLLTPCTSTSKLGPNLGLANARWVERRLHEESVHCDHRGQPILPLCFPEEVGEPKRSSFEDTLSAQADSPRKTDEALG